MPDQSGVESGSPSAPREFPAQQPRDLHATSDIRFVMVEIGRLTSTVERLVSDVRSQGEKIDGIRIRIAWVTGAAAVIGFMLALGLAALRFLPSP